MEHGLLRFLPLICCFLAALLGEVLKLSAPQIPHLYLLHGFGVETKEISRALSMVTGNSKDHGHLGLSLPEHLAQCLEYSRSWMHELVDG